jgi:MYXO-CTERM domain-containing protein
MKLLYTLALAGVSVVPAFSNMLNLDPGTGLTLYTNNSNDGYADGRGIWFQATSSFTTDGAGFYDDFSAGNTYTETLWSSDSTGTALHGTVLGSFTDTVGAMVGYDDGSFSAPISIVAGDYYYLEVTSTSAFNNNYFYNWNGIPTVDLGPLTILDGGQGGDPGALANSVAPGLQLDVEATPEPCSMAILGLGALGLLRRRRARA